MVYHDGSSSTVRSPGSRGEADEYRYKCNTQKAVPMEPEAVWVCSQSGSDDVGQTPSKCKGYTHHSRDQSYEHLPQAWSISRP